MAGTVFRVMFVKAVQALDLIMMALSLAVAYALSGRTPAMSGIGDMLYMEMTVLTGAGLAIALVIWHLAFMANGLYDSKRMSSIWDELKAMSRAISQATAIILLLGAILGVDITLYLVVCFWLISFASNAAYRLSLRLFLAYVRTRGMNRRYMVIVGTNERALRFFRQIASKPELGYRIIGFADDEWSEMNVFFNKTGVPRIADLWGLESYLRQNTVDEVAVFLPMRSRYAQARRILAVCQEQGVIARFPSSVFDVQTTSEARTEEFEGEAVTSFYTGSLHGWPVAIKRMLDITLSAALLILFLPLFAVVAILIRLTSPGPVFFTQPRLGLNKRRFTMIKFRTMVAGADKMVDSVAHLNNETGAAFKIRRDPRITALGKVLRKTSIDELPQLWNVLKGDMSLVGPRPFLNWEYERIQSPEIKRRFSVKPGLTGLWQVSGRNDVGFEKRIQLDLEYIDTWSLMLDCRLLVKTIPAVLLGKGAV